MGRTNTACPLTRRGQGRVMRTSLCGRRGTNIFEAFRLVISYGREERSGLVERRLCEPRWDHRLPQSYQNIAMSILLHRRQSENSRFRRCRNAVSLCMSPLASFEAVMWEPLTRVTMRENECVQ